LIPREFTNADRAAYRALNSGLRRHGDTASPVEQALALAVLIELMPEWGRSTRGGERQTPCGTR
jgi:hypothetical protein